MLQILTLLPNPTDEPVIPVVPPSQSLIQRDDEVRTIAVTFPPFDETNGQIRSVSTKMCSHYNNSNYVVIMLSLCSHYQVAVVIIPNGMDPSQLEHPDMEFRDINGITYDETFCDREFTSPHVYVTAEFARDLLPSNNEYIIGQFGQPTDRPVYTNGLLCYSKNYVFFLRAYTFANPVSDESSVCLLYTSPSPRDATLSRMPSSA